MGRPAHCPTFGPGIASQALGDANRGAFLASNPAVSTRESPSRRPPRAAGSLISCTASPARWSIGSRLTPPSQERAIVILVQRRVLLAAPRGFCAGVERAVD